MRTPRRRRKRDGFAKFYIKKFLRASEKSLNELARRVRWNKNVIYRLSQPPEEKSKFLELAEFSSVKHKVPMRAASWYGR
jgi:hypothetical protein